MGLIRATLVGFLSSASALAGARAEEIHLDCAAGARSAAVDVDTERRFVQLMWSDGIAEEFQEGFSYDSGPDASGRTEKVTYSVHADGGLVTFGQDRRCVEKGRAGRCAEQRLLNTLDSVRGELKYDDGGVVAIMKCSPAPPGRGF